MKNMFKCYRSGVVRLLVFGIIFLIVCLATSFIKPLQKHPRIVNIINFIRLLEPRVDWMTEDVLYQTVVSQVQMMDKYKLGGTFLLQYDALMDSRYQKLFKDHPGNSLEIGAWWEIPQPLVEKAGLTWRGRYPWDWEAKVDFSTGYSTTEREKLVDVYMDDFKRIYGAYPKSVGSWFIDAYTLNYMYKKYGIVASCNCKDQIGTDGYTLWGGYWNQAYYPSVNNAYMPAQHEENQIPVPIFRMLGSDPVRQYDDGVGGNSQGVVSLEPVYKGGGGDSAWVNWYFKQFEEGACMEYAYVQAGQENSFTWEKMAKGFGIQLPLIARLRDEQKVKVETLEQSGQWFRQHYKTTPATAVTVNEDLAGSDKKTVWFDSRFFRMNLLWEKGTLRFRDIHLFNEDLSDGLPAEGTSAPCSFYTLPFMDGNIWSDSKNVAGIRLKAMVGGRETAIEGGDPVVSDSEPGQLHISWPLKSMEGKIIIDINEREMRMRLEGNPAADWFLDLNAGQAVNLPFTKIGGRQVDCQFKGLDYRVRALKGSFSKPDDRINGGGANGGGTSNSGTGGRSVFRIKPEDNAIALQF